MRREGEGDGRKVVEEVVGIRPKVEMVEIVLCVGKVLFLSSCFRDMRWCRRRDRTFQREEFSSYVGYADLYTDSNMSFYIPFLELFSLSPNV